MAAGGDEGVEEGALGKLGAQVHVWVKGLYLVITVSVISRTANSDAAVRTLAEAAVARL